MGNSKGYTHTHIHIHTLRHIFTYARRCILQYFTIIVHMSKMKEQHIPNKILLHPYAFHAVFTFSVVLYYILFYSHVKFANAVDVFISAKSYGTGTWEIKTIMCQNKYAHDYTVYVILCV